MEITGGRTYTLIADAKPGELILFENYQTKSIGILMSSPDGEPLVAALNDPHEGHPRLLRLSSDDHCVSFGINWCIEPIEGEQSFPWSHDVNRRSGILALNVHGWAITVANGPVDQSGRVSLVWVSLETLNIVDRIHRAAFYDHWKIWKSANDLTDPHSTPLFEFKATPTRSVG